jgi:tetratricopeptide (TPR) repeat protein
MIRFTARWLLLIFPSLVGFPAWAQTPANHLEATTARTARSSRAIAPISRQQLFGTLPLATRSEEARKLVETSVDQYENALLDASVGTARQAAAKDPHCALAYAVWSFAARRGVPSPEARQRAKALSAGATSDERLLVKWMLDVQEGDMLPAIRTMNDLLKRFPHDKHILYLTSEWLYFQQDYDRARKRMEETLALDPDFAPALNMLGYSYIETGTPDPAKAIDYLKRYAAAQPQQPNPQDSLGEVSRYAGDDQGSLEHYSAALKIDPHFITSQVGLGDTSAMMGDYARARSEYDKALPIITTSRDRLHAEFQRALVYFWENRPEQGRTALDVLLEQARREKDPYAQFEIGFGRALLTPESIIELTQLRALVSFLTKPVKGMSDPDRNISLAAVQCEQARMAALSRHLDAAQEAVAKLERSAKQTRDLVVEDNYEAARGYLLFAKGDTAGAAEALAGNPRSPLALQQLALAHEKLGNANSLDAVRTRLKYLRAPTVEWYLITHTDTTAAR